MKTDTIYVNDAKLNREERFKYYKRKNRVRRHLLHKSLDVPFDAVLEDAVKNLPVPACTYCGETICEHSIKNTPLDGYFA